MASAVKGSVEKFFNDIDCCNAVDEAGRKHKHIGIIVAAGKLGKLYRPAQSRAYALMFVEGYAYAVARTAESYAGITGTLLYSLGTGMCIIGIITAFGRECAEILKFDVLRAAFSFHILHDRCRMPRVHPP